MATKPIDINKLYLKLLDVYKNKNNDEYLKERKVISDLLKDKNYDFKYKNGFIPYPDYEDEEFNKKIYSKKEFNKNKSILDVSDFDTVSNNQCSQTNFSLTSNQRFIKGFLSPSTHYNGLLLFHSVGTGKSCSAISIAEQYHEIYKKRVLVILSSTLVENFKKQIFDINKYDIKRNIANMCTGTKYPEMILDKQKLDKDSLDKKIKNLINEKYQFIGYKELAIKMDNIKNKIELNEVDPIKIDRKFNERLSEMFSDRLVIIDEAHNLRNPTETGKKQISAAFKTLLKYVENVKLVLLTATPMFNNSKEIVWTLNLLLSNDKRPEIRESMIFDKHGNLTESGRTTLINKSKGYISYMRGENPFAFPFRLYPSINNDINLLKNYPKKDIYGKIITKSNQIKYLEIVSSNMSEYQKEVYDTMKVKIKKNINIDDEIDDEEELVDDIINDNINNDLQNTMQISNIVYPSKDVKDIKSLYGSKGFDLNFKTSDKGKFQYKTNSNQFLTYNKISNYAPKIKSILDYIINSKGIVFVYSRYYASGIIPLAIALEHIGFAKYGTSNITQNIDIDDKFNGKKPKYIILSRKKELSPNNDVEIALSKNSDNQEGEKIKVIIVSKIGTEGIDFKRIREIHLLEPWFNLNRAEQIIGRGVRYCSHIDLPKSKRNVTIMFHAAKYDDNEESIDLRTYRIAENKQKKIIEIEKILKETSIDCNLNKSTLVYPIKKLNIAFDIETSQGHDIKSYKIGDVDNSQICNYEKCKAICIPDIDENKIEVDESTFDTKFIMDDIDLYKKYISLLYKNPIVSYSYEQIIKILKKDYNNIEEEILLYALDDMIIRKYILFDSKDRSGYLIYRANQYLFQQTRFSDTRLTIEEREEITNNRKNLLLLELHSKTIQPIKIISNSKNNKIEFIDSKKILVSINVQYEHTLEIIYQIVIDSFISTYNKNQISELLKTNKYIDKYIKNNFEDIIKKIKVSDETKKIVIMIENLMNRFDDSIIDSIIDRLSNNDLLILIQDIANKYNKKTELSQIEKKYLRSLVSGSIIFVDDEKIKYYYNYFDDDLYCIKSDGIFKKCNAIDLVKLEEYITIIKNKKLLGLNDQTIGYISMKNKNGIDIQFKIKDNKGSGYVCHKTSSLKIDDLKKMIKKIAPEMISNNSLIKHVKSNLCLFYEIILRTYQGKLFQRPHYIKN